MEKEKKYTIIIDVDDVVSIYTITEDEATNKDWNEIINELVDESKEFNNNK